MGSPSDKEIATISVVAFQTRFVAQCLCMYVHRLKCSTSITEWVGWTSECTSAMIGVVLINLL